MKYTGLLLTLFLCLAPTGFGKEEPTNGPDKNTIARDAKPLAGLWLAAETAEEKNRRLQAIDEATEHMGRFKRGRARKRLSDRTSPPQSLIIDIEGSKVSIGSGDRRLELEIGGPPVEAKGSEGKAQVGARMEGQRLIVVARSSKGERTTAYDANEARMLVEVTMTATELSRPLKYVSTYNRSE